MCLSPESKCPQNQSAWGHRNHPGKIHYQSSVRSRAITSCSGTYALSAYTAGVFSLLSSAEHVIHDASGRCWSVSILAHLVVPHAHCHLLQDVWLRSVLLQASPPDDGGSLPGKVRPAKCCQAHRPHVGHLWHLVLKGDHCHALWEYLGNYWIRTLTKALPCVGSAD